MGCRAFTPPVVGLARELEGEPFHLVASHNQGGDGEHALAEMFRNGLAPFSPNVSVTKSARHPGVTGTGYVPYYMIFDHHGDLVHHHQGGPYHGGDGTEALDRVRALLKEVPAVYLGKEPFAEHAKLAKKIASGKKLRAPLEELAALAAAHPEDAELQRLVAGVERHRDRIAAHVERLLATDPAKAKKEATAAAKDFAGTPWSGPLDELATSLADRELGKRREAAAKEIAQIMKAFGKLEPVRGNAGEVRNPLDPEFRQANEKALKKLVAKLERLRDDDGELAAGRRAVELLGLLAD